jgi:hypothetical protein
MAAYKMTPENLERLKRWEPPQRPQIIITAEKLSWWPGWNIIFFNGPHY